MKGNRKIYVVGGVILALAAVIVLSAVLVPPLVQKSRMKKILSAVPDATRIVLGDPTFDNGDILGNNGKEVLLEGEDLQEIRKLLANVAAGGYRHAGEEDFAVGRWDPYLKLRTADGEVFYIRFAQDRFYRTESELAIFFEAKDQAAYTALYERMQTILQEK